MCEATSCVLCLLTDTTLSKCVANHAVKNSNRTIINILSIKKMFRSIDRRVPAELSALSSLWLFYLFVCPKLNIHIFEVRYFSIVTTRIAKRPRQTGWQGIKCIKSGGETKRPSRAMKIITCYEYARRGGGGMLTFPGSVWGENDREHVRTWHSENTKHCTLFTEAGERFSQSPSSFFSLLYIFQLPFCSSTMCVSTSSLPRALLDFCQFILLKRIS